MASIVKGARIVNDITYQTDRQSLKKVRKELQALKQLSSKSSVQAAKAEVKAAKEAADAEIKQAKRVMQFHEQQARKGRGTGMVGNAGMYDAAKVARQTAQMNNLAQKSVSERLRQQERQQKAAAKQRKEALDRDINGTMALRKNAFDINRLQGLDIAQRYQAIQQARQLADQYKRGALDIKEMNEGMRQLKATTSATARQARNMAKREGRPAKKGNSSWLTSGAAFGGLVPALSLAGLTYGSVAMSREALSGAIERQQGRKQMLAQGAEPFEGEAVRRAVVQQTGFQMSNEKYSDIAKDVQDKVGDLSNGQWKQNAKTKEWSYSGGGELSNVLNMMVSRGGFGRDEAVSTLRSAKGPAELAIILNNLKKSANLTDSELTNMSESINDFSWIVKSAGDNGSNFADSAMQLARTGLVLNDQQQKSVEYLGKLSQTAQNVGDSLQDQFAAAAGKQMQDLGLSSKSLEDAFSELRPIAQELGKEFGSLAAWLVSIIKYIPGSASYNSSAAQASQDNFAWASQQNDPFVKWLVQRWSSTSTAGADSWNAAQANADAGPTLFTGAKSGSLDQFNSGNPFAMNLPNLQLQMAGQVQVSVNAGALTDLFGAEMDTRISNSWDNATFSLDQSQSYD
ncbi:hypothetical protein [Pantoea ananatis]|uniref:hypothetical protein n=1 Tax=Pantoea ananas TaxID=553 RepID=UPI001B311727|nr:hypothetical protein [Pantoea ananatis]